MPFFTTLEEEIVKAEIDNKEIIISFDANSKLGTRLIEKDPNMQSPNGAILEGIMSRHALTVVNGLQEKVSGLITRRRSTINREEISIIDFVIISDELIQYLESFTVDESKDYALTKLTKSKNGTQIKESDHNTLISKFNIKWKKSPKREIQS